MIDNEKSESGIMLECYGAILENDKAEKLREFMRTTKGWKSDETSIILSLQPIKKVSWFLK